MKNFCKECGTEIALIAEFCSMKCESDYEDAILIYQEDMDDLDLLTSISEETGEYE